MQPVPGAISRTGSRRERALPTPGIGEPGRAGSATRTSTRQRRTACELREVLLRAADAQRERREVSESLPWTEEKKSAVLLAPSPAVPFSDPWEASRRRRPLEFLNSAEPAADGPEEDVDGGLAMPA